MENSITKPSLANQSCAHQTSVERGQGTTPALKAWSRNTTVKHITVKYCNIVLNTSV